jgi:hypothetical protein
MQGSAWFSILQKIPPAQHDNLVLMTNTGLEIVLQGILRIEPEFLVARGRMAGTTDTGRMLFLPFDQITYLGFHKRVTEAEVRAMFDSPGLPFSTAAAKAEPGASAPEEAPVGEEPAPSPGTPAAPAAPVKPAPPSKTTLLARLRSRLQNNNSRPPQG